MPNNRRSLLSISRPMNPDPINLKRILSTNNCRLAYQQLSSRDGTFISVSCKPHINHQYLIHNDINHIHQPQPHSIFQYHNLNDQQQHQHHTLTSPFNLLSTISFLSITFQNLNSQLIHFLYSKPLNIQHLQIYHTIP